MIQTVKSQTSTSGSASGSASTIFVPSLHIISSLSNLSDSLSMVSHCSYSTYHMCTTDDMSVSNQTYIYPSDPHVIAPSCSSSLCRTSLLTDLDAEFMSAVSRARNARPGLGFGLSLFEGSVLGDGLPITVSSSP